MDESEEEAEITEVEEEEDDNTEGEEEENNMEEEVDEEVEEEFQASQATYSNMAYDFADFNISEVDSSKNEPTEEEEEESIGEEVQEHRTPDASDIDTRMLVAMQYHNALDKSRYMLARLVWGKHQATLKSKGRTDKMQLTETWVIFS